MTSIIDYGLGNLGSISNMLAKLGHASIITRDHTEIMDSSKIILPGVGSFDMGMENLKKYDLLSVLNEKRKDKSCSILGICLGMQLLTDGSEEGKLKGLGWVPGFSKKFNTNNVKVPHMGWNRVAIRQTSPLTSGFDESFKFYFVHSYYVECENENDVLTYTSYDNRFASSLNHENVFGVQFHPEKSHRFGMKLLDNFMKIS